MALNNVNHDSFGEENHSESADSLTGDGGDVLEIWSSTRTNKLRNLAGGGTFTNNSSFIIPAGLVDSSANPYDVSFEDGEAFHGVSAVGTPLDRDGTPLSGTASLEQDGETAVSASVSSLFVLSAAPPPSAIRGDNSTGTPTYTFRFTPSKPGIDYTKDGITTKADLGTFQYGSVAGTVTDYAGEPIEGDAVFGDGAGDKTDKNGRYEIAAPGGTQITLYAVGTSTQETPNPGEETTVNFQYARLVVDVVTPALDPVEGTKVQIGKETHTTDENGRVVLDPAPVTTYQVLVSDYIFFEADIQQQGELFERRIGDDDDKAGVKLRLVDSRTGDVVRSLPGEFEDKGLRSKSGRDGQLALFTDEAGDVALTLGGSDNRYKTKEYTLGLTAGDTAEARVEVEPKPQVTNK